MQGYNFTERVRKVLNMSADAARELGHEYVATEHILLGLLREREGTAILVLHRLGVDLDDLEQRGKTMVPRGRQLPAGVELPFTSRSKKILELAMSERREQGHKWVGTEHLLLGMLREERGIGAQLLNDAGVTLEIAREQILHILSERDNEPATLGETSQASRNGGRGLLVALIAQFLVVTDTLTDEELGKLLGKSDLLTERILSVLND